MKNFRPSSVICGLPSRKVASLQYRPSLLDNAERIEDYCYGGFHPVHLDDTFADGRYQILHKLGYGGLATVWLGRDRLKERLVSLKIIKAQASSKACSEPQILQHLKASTVNHPGRSHIMPLLDDFRVEGLNGSHMCLVSQVFGPSITQLSYYPGRVAGCRRLHTSGVVYGGTTTLSLHMIHIHLLTHVKILTASNVLLRLTNIDAWSDKEIYERLGPPVKDNVLDSAGDTAGRYAPGYLVEPANLSHLDPRFLTKDIVLIDFGQSFRAELPPDHGTGTPPHTVRQKRSSGVA